MSIKVRGAVATPLQTAAFGLAVLEDLAEVLPTIGLAPVAVALTQHTSRADGVQPALLLVLEGGKARTQLLDVARTGMSAVFNEVLPAVAPKTSGLRPAPDLRGQAPAGSQQTPPVAAAPAAAPEPPAPPAADGDAGAGDDATQRIWAAFEDAVRPQLGRGAGKAVQASRKAARGMSQTETVEFLADRLTRFGAHAVDSFRAALLP